MNINKWTLGLAAVGLVSLVPAARADDAAKPVPLTTALSATTISGYVDTSAVWNPGSGNANPAPYSFNGGKQDGFNVDSIDIRLQKALEEGQWSAGYVAELMFGPDSQGITGGAGFLPEYIRQAYVEFRVPIGNGLDFEMGRFDNLIGYESSDSYKNPNWTRSYGYSFEPTEHTGLLATYKFSDMITAQAGVADTVSTVPINARTTGVAANGSPEGKKALISLVTLTAPDSWGFLKGSSIYGGVDWGQGPAGGAPARVHTYLGGTLNTPVKDLTLGGAWDYIAHEDFAGADTGHAYAIAGYASYKITDKMTLNGRAEYAEGGVLAAASADPGFHEVFALTGTLQYDLWANVISRLEVRWDHACDGGTPFGGTVVGFGAKKNEVLVAANIIYKF
ncbi:MAG TPA: outer membrane beta-barrel protein [Verrucomicrobiae bacterium]|nr:outer membrane beta-barrel protein [Verrucomicrobiae bacterium]